MIRDVVWWLIQSYPRNSFSFPRNFFVELCRLFSIVKQEDRNSSGVPFVSKQAAVKISGIFMPGKKYTMTFSATEVIRMSQFQNTPWKILYCLKAKWFAFCRCIRQKRHHSEESAEKQNPDPRCDYGELSVFVSCLGLLDSFFMLIQLIQLSSLL